jgi:NTP pyrophosphatase (non-canonical NTP hydrolase)
MYTLAGSFAEQLEIWGEIRPEPLEEVLSGYEIGLEDLETFEEHPGDTLYLVKYLKAMSGDPMDGDLEENYHIVVKDTEEEVRRRWSEIKAVAEMLERCGRLEGEEVAALIAPQQPPK